MVTGIEERGIGCSYNRGKEDGLSVRYMRVNWGGKQSRVRDTEIRK
jgi:hypothetical protein